MRYLVQATTMALAALMMSATMGFAETSKTEKRNDMRMKAVERVDVRGPGQFKAIMSGRDKGGAGGIVECQPVDSKWCNEGFPAFCAKSNGVGSTKPDGSLICTYPGAG